MILPKVYPRKWSELYGLKIDRIPCQKCGFHQDVNIPYAEGSF